MTRSDMVTTTIVALATVMESITDGKAHFRRDTRRELDLLRLQTKTKTQEYILKELISVAYMQGFDDGEES